MSSSSAHHATNDLTSPEWEALRALEEAPFFAPTMTNHVLSTDDFSNLWRGRKAQLDAVGLQPYCDVLYQEMRKELLGMKAELSSALRQKIGEASHPRELKIPFKSFFSTYEPSWPQNCYEGSDIWKAMVEFRREEYVMAQTILDNGWDARIAVVREPEWEDTYCPPQQKSWTLRPQRIYAIVKKTDLLQRLAALFGPDFSVSLKSEYEPRTVDGREYLVYRNTFHLHYIPHQTTHWQKVIASTLVKYATHSNFPMTYYDTVVGYQGETVLKTSEPC